MTVLEENRYGPIYKKGLLCDNSPFNSNKCMIIKSTLFGKKPLINMKTFWKITVTEQCGWILLHHCAFFQVDYVAFFIRSFLDCPVNLNFT